MTQGNAKTGGVFRDTFYDRPGIPIPQTIQQHIRQPAGQAKGRPAIR